MILILTAIWHCTVINAATGEVFSATSPIESRAKAGAMNRCYFFTGADSVNCMLDKCELKQVL